MRLPNARPDPRRGPTVFISYRRDDSSGYAGRLRDALRERWGDRNVRMDADDIPLGADFTRIARELVATSDILLVLIGTRWLEGSNAERLTDRADLLRLEIETALEKEVHVIPVLLNGASMPGPDRLPPSLLPLLKRNAYVLSDRRWTDDVRDFVSGMERLSGHTDVPEERRAGPLAWMIAVVFLAGLALAVVTNRAPRSLETTGAQDSIRHDSPSISTRLPEGKSPSGWEPPVTRDSSLPHAHVSTHLPNEKSPARQGPAPPPAPPLPRPPPPSTTGSVAGLVSSRVGPTRYKDYGLTITESRPCRLHGRVETTAGGARDIDVMVLGLDEFENFRHSRTYTPIFLERRAAEVTLDVLLPGPGQYHLVLSNRFSGFTSKVVRVEGVRWECTEREVDTSTKG